MKIYTVLSLLQNYRHSKIPVTCILQLLLPYILWQFQHLLWEGMSDLAEVICQWYKVPILFFTWAFGLFIYNFFRDTKFLSNTGLKFHCWLFFFSFQARTYGPFSSFIFEGWEMFPSEHAAECCCLWLRWVANQTWWAGLQRV